MHQIDPEKMMLSTGETVADRLRAFADALVAHNQRGIFIMLDLNSQRWHISGHVPEDREKLRDLLEDLVQKLNEGMSQTDGLSSIRLPQQH